MEKIKNVVFDLGGVLVGLDFDRCTAVPEPERQESAEIR